MIDIITNASAGRTTMSVIPYSNTEETSADFEEVLNTVTYVTKTTEGMDLEGIFEEASNTYGVPVYLLKAVAKAESNFNANDVSRSGAMGIMQLMPETAEELGVVNAFDPEENIMGGAKYLAEKLAQYSGDVELALAAYNAGSGNVEKYGGIPPFEETQNYVKKVTAYMEEYKQETTTAAASNTQTASAGNANASTAAVVSSAGDTNISSYAANNPVLEAYERLKDGTYWKVLE